MPNPPSPLQTFLQLGHFSLVRALLFSLSYEIKVRVIDQRILAALLRSTVRRLDLDYTNLQIYLGFDDISRHLKTERGRFSVFVGYPKCPTR